MWFKSFFLMTVFCCLSLAVRAAEAEPTIGGAISKVESFMQVKGAVVVAVVGDPTLLKAAGLSEIAVNDRVEITNLGDSRFKLVDLKRGRQVIANCRAWFDNQS